MRRFWTGVTLGLTLLTVAGCDNDRAVKQQLEAVNAVDAADLSDVMLTVADPNEAVRFFQRTSAEQPGKIDYIRGLAKSQVRAGRSIEAVSTWTKVVAHPEATNEDRVGLADANIRANQWDQARIALDAIPPTFETYDRYRLEAMVADSAKDWTRADSFYEIAVGLTTQPASVLNNWGYSKLTRGKYSEAEQLFLQSLKNDQSRFTVKNNLILARAAQGNYAMPVMQMTQSEKAELLHTLGLSAVKRGDVNTAKQLFREAVETHPQYFEAAVRSLEALENS
jgi:Tfp pilus assembly protein PilF